MLRIQLNSGEEAFDEAFAFYLVHISHQVQKDLWLKGETTNQRGWSWAELICRTLGFLGDLLLIVYVL